MHLCVCIYECIYVCRVHLENSLREGEMWIWKTFRQLVSSSKFSWISFKHVHTRGECLKWHTILWKIATVSFTKYCDSTLSLMPIPTLVSAAPILQEGVSGKHYNISSSCECRVALVLANVCIHVQYVSFILCCIQNVVCTYVAKFGTCLANFHIYSPI